GEYPGRFVLEPSPLAGEPIRPAGNGAEGGGGWACPALHATVPGAAAEAGEGTRPVHWPPCQEMPMTAPNRPRRCHAGYLWQGDGWTRDGLFGIDAGGMLQAVDDGPAETLGSWVLPGMPNL